MKKLLYITTNLQGSGGVARILSVKLNYLIRVLNYEVFVIETNKKNEEFFYDFDERITFNYIHTKNVIKYKKELKRWVNKLNPDVIVNCDNGLKGSLLSYIESSKKKLIYERHCSKNIAVSGFKEQIKLKLSNLLLQFHIKKYAYFIVLNSDEAKNWTGENIEVVPNPLWFPKQIKIKRTPNKIVTAVGRHAYEKGYGKLLNIWEDVIKNHPDWMLKIYGEKNKNVPLETMVVNKGLERNIKLFDPIDNVEKIYSEANMLLSTSISESFPLVFVEAMAYGLPVVSFEGTSGLTALVENNKNGFLIKNNDASSYIEKVNLLIENENLRHKMGDYAKNSVERKLGLVDIMERWHQLFNSI